MKRIISLIMIAVLSIAMVIISPSGPVFAADNWYETWDAYGVPTNVHGLGGWKGWANNPSASAMTIDTGKSTGPIAIDIYGSADLVHEFSGYTTGKWTFSVMQFIPASFSGQTYFIMLNQYNDSISGLNWSTQVYFDGSSNLVAEQMTSSSTTSLIRDAWIPIRIEIDLDADKQMFYYNDVLLYDGSWTAGVSGGGSLNIGAVDLFANFSTSVYYDDFSLTAAQVNLKPVVGDDEFSTVKNEYLDADVSGNDSDDGLLTTLTYFNYTDPSNGSLIFNSDGTFRYTPKLNFVGDDQFTYFVYDGEYSTVGTVTIHVTDVRRVDKLVISGPNNVFVYKTHTQDYLYKVTIYDQYGQIMPDEAIAQWAVSPSGLPGVTITSFTSQTCIVTLAQNPNPSAGATFYIKATAENGKEATYKVKINKSVKK